MAGPAVGRKGPITIDIGDGQTVWWRRCGRTARRSFGGGGHLDRP